jgi:hypothetical protein
MFGFANEIIERGVIYSVGAIVIFRAIKNSLNWSGKKEYAGDDGADLNGVSQQLYNKMSADKMKGYARSAVVGQAQLCNQRLATIEKEQSEQNKKLDTVIKTQTSNHNEVIRAIGRLEGRAAAGGAHA